MKAHTVEFREKIVKAYQAGGVSMQAVAQRFDVARSFVQKILKQQQQQGHLRPAPVGRPLKTKLEGDEAQLREMVAQYPDATLSEYCQYWEDTHKVRVSRSTMCRALQKVQLTRKKRLSVPAKLRVSACNR